MTTEIEAAGRLRTTADVLAAAERSRQQSKLPLVDPFHAIEDMNTLAVGMMRELDQRVIDEAFAKSVAVERGNGIGLDDEMGVIHLDVFYFGHAKQLHLIGNDSRGWTLKYADQLICNACTIGQFHTAIRLFGITLTRTGAEA